MYIFVVAIRMIWKKDWIYRGLAIFKQFIVSNISFNGSLRITTPVVNLRDINEQYSTKLQPNICNIFKVISSLSGTFIVSAGLAIFTRSFGLDPSLLSLSLSHLVYQISLDQCLFSSQS